MTDLIDFCYEFAERGECVCPRCLDSPNPDPTHSVSTLYFLVHLKQPLSVELLRATIKQHRPIFITCDPLDGKEHDFIEVARWVGDQHAALLLMGMGALLNIWRLNLDPEKGTVSLQKEAE